MKRKLIGAVALMIAVTAGGPLAVSAASPEKPWAERVTDPDAAAAEYDRLLADYRKDLAAYEADPGIWTAEVPRMPARPESPKTAALRTQATQRQ
jgi:hypothetical protein